MKGKVQLFAVILLFSYQNISYDIIDSVPLETEEAVIFIDIATADLTTNAHPRNEVPDFVTMHNGAADYGACTSGVADLTTQVSPGQVIRWELGDAEAVTVTGFDFQLIDGDDLFAGAGSHYPTHMPDGSYETRVADEIAPESAMKYSVYFEPDGQVSYWWDPLMKSTSRNS